MESDYREKDLKKQCSDKKDQERRLRGGNSGDCNETMTENMTGMKATGEKMTERRMGGNFMDGMVKGS